MARKNIEPITGSSNVIVENWTTCDRGVRISIGVLPVNFDNHCRSPIADCRFDSRRRVNSDVLTVSSVRRLSDREV